jgi:hypothetical protein
MSRRPPAPPLASLVLAALARAARWAAPVARRGLRRGAQLAGHGLRATGRTAWRQRAAIAALAVRVAWWSALALLLAGGRPILGLGALPERTAALAPFVAGLVLCGGVRLWAAPRRLRVAALALGVLHGAALVLVWTAFAG